MNLFGKKKPAGPNINQSIQTLRETMTQLEKREKFLEKQMNQCVDEAKKKAKNKDKRGALFQLKRKKMFEKQIEQIYGKRVNLETQIMALEEASNTKQVFNAMKLGSAALKSAVRESDIENVDDVIEDISQQIGLVDEVSEAMSQPIGQQLDDDELEAELADLDQELMEDDIINLAAPIKPKNKASDINIGDLPSVGHGKPKRQETDEEREERELKELESMLA